jgi:hypothetical protein
MSWMSSGSKAVTRWRDEDSTRSEKFWLKPDRYWMPKDTKKVLVWVDEDGVAIREHAVRTEGHRREYVTCSSGEQGAHAHCCQKLGREKGEYYRLLVWTIVDTTEFTTKEGKTRRNEIRLFPAKWNSSEKILDRQNDYGLEYSVFRVRRYNQTFEPSVGSDFDFQKKVEDRAAFFNACFYKGEALSKIWDAAEEDALAMERLKKLFQVKFDPSGKLIREVVPFNYSVVLAPPSAQEIDALALKAQAARGGYQSNQSNNFGSSTPGSNNNFGTMDDFKTGIAGPDGFSDADIPF